MQPVTSMYCIAKLMYAIKQYNKRYYKQYEPIGRIIAGEKVIANDKIFVYDKL